MKIPLYIPSYEDAAGTDPITPAVAFAGGVVSKNHIPVTVDWDTFPVGLSFSAKNCMCGPGGFNGQLLPLSKPVMPLVYSHYSSNFYYAFSVQGRLVYFKNGYIGWIFSFDATPFGEQNELSSLHLVLARALDIAQGGISPIGRYTLVENNSHSGTGSPLSVQPTYEIISS